MAAGSASFTVTEHGLRLRRVTGSVDVLLDGQRVWSVGPDAGTVTPGGWRRVRWPAGLRAHLDGLSVVALRDAATGEVLGEVEHRFGDGPGRVHVTDRQGHPMVVSKWGGATYAFGDLAPAARERWTETIDGVLGTLAGCGLPAFLSYGTLLGAVRGGSFIGHDVDADVSYLSRYEHPADVVRESFAVERRLREAGWKVRRSSGAFLQVFHQDGAGKLRNVDVFASFFLDGTLYEDFAVGAALPRSALLPLGTATLDGRTFPVPNDAPAVLEATYGPGWSVPDPGFAFDVPPATRRRLAGWFGGYRTGRREWSRSYGGGEAGVRRSGPSQLARLAHERAPAGALVVDVGCGAGADARWLAQQGHPVLGLDYAPSALRLARQGNPSRRARFEPLNLADTRLVLARGALVGRSAQPVVVLARHVADAVTEPGRRNLWRFCRLALAAGGDLFLETREHATETSGVRHHPVDAATVMAELTGAGAATVTPVATDGEHDAGDASGVDRVHATWRPPGRSVRSRG